MVSSAAAHAPIPRQVVVSPDGAAVAVDLPGFGLVLRAHPEQPFVYACSALFESMPSADPPALGFVSDGSLLVGSRDGLHTFSANGCPLEPAPHALARAEVMRLALQPPNWGAGERGQAGYAAVGGDLAGLWRTTDSGRSWTLRSPLAVDRRTTAVVMRADSPEQVYLTVEGPTDTTLYASADGGASLEAFSEETTFTLLHAEGKASGRLWAIARDAQTVGNRGLAILRADGPAGPWRTVLRVNYFGGFVMDSDGVIWVGDEIGGVYRSTDGGDTFENLESEADVACLAYGGAALWACSPGVLRDPVLRVLPSGAPPFTGVVALSDVEHLVECPGIDVGRVCAGAWVEWQRDVLMRPIESPEVLPEADASAGPSVRDASVASCALQLHANRSRAAQLFLGLLLAARLRLRKRGQSRRPAANPSDGLDTTTRLA